MLFAYQDNNKNQIENYSTLEWLKFNLNNSVTHVRYYTISMSFCDRNLKSDTSFKIKIGTSLPWQLGKFCVKTLLTIISFEIYIKTSAVLKLVYFTLYIEMQNTQHQFTLILYGILLLADIFYTSWHIENCLCINVKSRWKKNLICSKHTHNIVEKEKKNQ